MKAIEFITYADNEVAAVEKMMEIKKQSNCIGSRYFRKGNQWIVQIFFEYDETVDYKNNLPEGCRIIEIPEDLKGVYNITNNSLNYDQKNITRENSIISFEQNNLCFIPGGKFYYKQKVKLMEPFCIGICPVTNLEYERFDPEHEKRRDKYSNADDGPVIYVSYNDIEIYCKWLSKETGYHKSYRLPTEVEWEYACRAGSTGLYSLDIDGIEVNQWNLKEYAVYNTKKTMPVKQHKPNLFGLYDMHGNVWEWCQDYYHNDYGFGGNIVRGGSWRSKAEDLCSSNWKDYEPNSEFMNDVGFRVVCDART
jgi:ferredoxin